MDKNKLIRIIGKDLEELKFLTEEIAESQNSSQLIVDLALSKARLLCQEILVLRECLGLAATTAEECTKEEPIGEECIPEPEVGVKEEQKIPDEKEIVFGYGKEEPDDEESDDEIEFSDTKENDPIEEEPIEADNSYEVKETTLIEFEEQPAAPKTETKSSVKEMKMVELDDDNVDFAPQPARKVMREIPKPEQPVQTTAPLIEEPQKERSLNETMGESKTAETTLGNGPISSLKTAIGLNDRFLFIREIFGNNTDKYNTIIDHLDKLESIQQAVDYLKINLTLQKNETSMKFVDLLKRRFSKQ